MSPSAASGAQAGEHLAGQPLERAVLAEVDDRVGAPHAVDPAIAGQVVVGRRELGVVVDRDRILAVAARWLDRHEHVAELESGDDEVLVGSVDILISRGRAPALLDRVAQFDWQRPVPGLVVGDGVAERGAREMRVGEELGVMAAGGDQGVDQLIAVGEVVLDAHSVLLERGQQPQRTGRRVEPDRHPDPGVLGREAREQHRHAALRGCDLAQAGMPDREAGGAGTALRVRDVSGDRHPDRRAGGVAFLERDHAGQQASVELGDRHLRGGVERL